LRRRTVAIAWLLWTLTMLGILAAVWLNELLDEAGCSDLDRLGVSSIPLLAGALAAATVGVVIAVRRSEHPVGWLLLVLGLLLAADAAGFEYVRYGAIAVPGSLPLARWLAGPLVGTGLVWMSVAGFLMLLTPTGSLPSPRWRWRARVAAAGPVLWVLANTFDPAPLKPEHPGFVNPLAAPAVFGIPLMVAGALGAIIVLVSVVAAAFSLVGRYRRAKGIERLQLRWLAFAAGAAAVLVLVALAGVATSTDALVQFSFCALATVLVLATGAAVLRYRLYDLDRIISRALAYGLLTVLLGGTYAAVVLGLSSLLSRGHSLIVAGATLAVAAVFQPARRAIQGAMDRRFDRRRYDAARTIGAFSARLRQQVDLDTLTAEVLAVVDQTVQPRQASLWLRSPHRTLS
jgi:hypothetical protein